MGLGVSTLVAMVFLWLLLSLAAQPELGRGFQKNKLGGRARKALLAIDLCCCVSVSVAVCSSMSVLVF